MFAIKHPDGRYWSVGENNKIVLGPFPSMYEFHDENHIRNCDTGLCVRHSYYVLYESRHDSVPGDFEWTVTPDGQIISPYGGGSNVVADGDGLKIANDGSTTSWNVVYKKNRFCLCSDISKCTCNDPVTPIFTQPPEEIVGTQEPLDVRAPKVQKMLPPEALVRLLPPEVILPEILEKISTPETPSELPAPAPETPSEIPVPAPETPSEPSAPAPETPSEIPVSAPETPLEPPAQPEN